MAPSEGLAVDLAGAILDGSPINWVTAESSADLDERPVVRQLRLVAEIADLHRLADLDAPLTEWGHLRVLERIGRGAFGEVYRAWDTRLDREVALKLLPDDSTSAGSRATAIIEEGRLLARVRHPNVATIYGAERIGGRVGLWMEFVKGRTLAHAIQQGTSFRPAEIAAIGESLARALDAVHQAGLLHRDIKAQNVMLAEDGRVVLMDFGTGLELDQASDARLAGTPLYLAPELLRGGTATARSDIYSVGVLLYHMATGAFPVQAASLSALRQAHADGQRVATRRGRAQVAAGLAGIIDRAVDPDAARRHQSAAELANALAGFATRANRAPRQRRAAIAAGLVAAAGLIWAAAVWPRSAAATDPGGRPVIAVLPFANQSTEPGSEEFVDGLTDELIRSLVGIDGLSVKARTSSFFFKNAPRDLQDVGRRLDVNHVVEGSVLREGRRIRVTASLVPIAGGEPLWSHKFDRDLDDVFAIQDEIARSIVNELRLTLGKGRRRYEANPQAYQIYLTARGLIDRRGVPNMLKAAQLFEEVIRLDPSFAPAHAGLATAYGLMTADGQGPSLKEALAVMRPAALRALELDPLDAEAHAAMGFLHTRDFNWPAATASYRRALDLNPTLTPAYGMFVTFVLGPVEDYDEARRLLDIARSHDPLSLDVLRYIGQWQLAVGNYEDAIDTFREVLARDPTFQYVYLSRALLFAGRLDEAIPLLAQQSGRGGSLAVALVQKGRRNEAEKLLDLNPQPAIRRAFIYAALGDKDRAFEALERGMIDEPQRLPVVLAWPEFDPLRGDPRLDALRRRLNLPPLDVPPPR